MSYLRVTRFLGALRGWYISGDSYYLDWDSAKKDLVYRPLPLIERVQVTAMASMVTPFLWPYFAARDYRMFTEASDEDRLADPRRRSRFDALLLV